MLVVRLTILLVYSLRVYVLIKTRALMFLFQNLFYDNHELKQERSTQTFSRQSMSLDSRVRRSHVCSSDPADSGSVPEFPF